MAISVTNDLEITELRYLLLVRSPFLLLEWFLWRANLKPENLTKLNFATASPLLPKEIFHPDKHISKISNLIEAK